MSFFSSPEGIKSGMYGLGLYVFGVSFVRMFKDTWFSAAGGGLGLSPAASQLALLAIGPPNAWITIKGLDIIGIPKEKQLKAILTGLLFAGVLDGTSFIYPPYP